MPSSLLVVSSGSPCKTRSFVLRIHAWQRTLTPTSLDLGNRGWQRRDGLPSH